MENLPVAILSVTNLAATILPETILPLVGRGAGGVGRTKGAPSGLGLV